MHAHIPDAVTVAAPVTYRRDDYVLYRDPERFWLGKAGHTVVCRVDAIVPFSCGEVRYTLVRLDTGARITSARARYMRLLPPADAMHDIDTAPLGDADTGVADMAPAAVAWLIAQSTTASRRPDLPRT
ncbi:hypothetical protein ACFC5Z_13770 [Streptomyces sp. NPDC056004]|uniref:hypothetical protein n=1 Tax=Streptomyces sp. NPDC056004 TaxID=3345677 RepID=UPI0035DB83E2